MAFCNVTYVKRQKLSTDHPEKSLGSELYTFGRLLQLMKMNDPS